MTVCEFVVRNATRSELDLIIDWAKREGWNPGLHDADCFWESDPSGFFIGLLNGEIISAISAVKYGDKFCHLGFYIAKPEHRGNGYGLALWNYAHDSIKSGICSLDGVVEQQSNYAKSGYKLKYRTVRFMGISDGSQLKSIDENIVPLSSIPFSKFEEYDFRCFPYRRTGFLKLWTSRPESTSVVYNENGYIKGYSTLRRCFDGYKIGPLFADNKDVAENLFNVMVSKVPKGESYYIDVPECNEDACNVIESHCLDAVFESARMYKGGDPDFPMKRWFGITTFELG
jgi:Acetyltransferase (GNAT) domain/Acetyltransferase (GNAT) family